MSRKPNQLTEREREVLRRYASGESIVGISSALGMGTKRVYDALDRAKNRTGFDSLIGLVHYAVKNGLVTLGDAK